MFTHGSRGFGEHCTRMQFVYLFIPHSTWLYDSLTHDVIDVVDPLLLQLTSCQQPAHQAFAYLPICLFALKSEELLLRRHDWVTPNVPYSPLVTGGNYPIVLLGLRMHAPARAPLDAAPWPSPKIHRSV